VLDGATGTMLQANGMPSGVCTEQWVVEHPEVLQRIQRAYVQAGSQVVYAPTFSANRVKLEPYGLADRVAEYNQKLVEISREAVEGKALVAGDLAPLGQFLPPMGDMDFETMFSVYQEQATALEDAGVDLFVIETTMTLPEARAALLAIRSVSTRPIYVTFTVDERGRTLTGTDVQAALVTMEAMGASAFGLNCSTGADAMLPQLARLTEHAGIPLIAKPNAGLPETVDGQTVYRCTPEEFASHVSALAQCGVRVFGGCCGTTPEHIAQLHQIVQAQSAESWPEPEQPFEVAVATEKDAYFLEDIDADDCVDITCSEDLLDDLLDAEEEEETFLKLHLSGAEDLDTFAECQYAVRKPLILDVETLEELEQALRLYQGVALYQDKGTIAPQELMRLSKTYGVRII
jgi:5-methyltetrahydrofolate--homocysteine methyltransferase